MSLFQVSIWALASLMDLKYLWDRRSGDVMSFSGVKAQVTGL